MREREKGQKPSGGPERSRPKPSTSTASSKPPTSSSSTVKSSKASASTSSSKVSATSSSTTKAATASSTPNQSSRAAKPSSRPAKALSSTVKDSSSRSHITPSRPPDNRSSSTSRSLKPNRLAISDTRRRSSNRDQRDEHSTPDKGEKSKVRKETRKEERIEKSTKEKKLSSTSTRGLSQSRRENSKNERKGDKKHETRSSSNQETGKEKFLGSRTKKEPAASQREPNRNRSNKDGSTKGYSTQGKSQTKQSSQRERKPENRKSKKDEQNKENRESRKSAQSLEKATRKKSNPEMQNEEMETQDSGMEAMNMGPVVISSQISSGQEVEMAEHSPNSLETMESGISLSSPQDLSGDEVEVEESISSKMVEVDEEDEVQRGAAMIDEESFLLRNEGGVYSTPSYQIGAVALESSLNFEDNENDDYEEDFEDYESDFEDDSGSGVGQDESSSGEEESSDSKSTSDEESDVDAPDPEVAAVLLALKEENCFESRLERSFSVDIPDQPKEPLSPEKKVWTEPIPEVEEVQMKQKSQGQVPRPKTSRTFINFEMAKKKQIMQQVSSRMTSRGRTLLNMIQLDTINMDLLTLSPVSYEAYISSFGQSNRQQVHVQTNEDALCEEVQTDEITVLEKWTQKPVHISVGTDNQLPGPQDYLGVGGDVDPTEYCRMPNKDSNTGYLTAFLTSASQVMLAILEEELLWDLAESESGNSSSSSSMEGLGFSHPPAHLGTSVKPLLDGRPIPFVQFCSTEPTLLLSGHGYQPVEAEDSTELNEGGLVCLWSVQEPSRPQQLLCCRASPTAATFSPSKPSLVLAGLEDGSLAAWDLREHLQFHSLKVELDNVNWRVRVPSFVTACDEDSDAEGSKIVAIQAVTTQEDLEANTQGSFQVVTLTNDGRVTWWVVVQVPLTSAVVDIGIGRKHAGYSSEESKVGVSPHIGAAPWARIALNRAATIDVATTLYGEHLLAGGITCHSLRIDPNDSSLLYVASGSGAVVHCSRHNSRTYPKSYVPDIEPGCEAVCLALCPHDSRYLLVGSGDGVVRLHSIEIDRPLTSWQSAPDSSPIVDLQWSPARPCVFYVLDSNARLHVWDLSAGDIFPVLTIEAGGLVLGNLSSFHVAPTQIASHQPLNAVFASDVGELVLRQVSSEFCAYEHLEDYRTELERFTYYVNII